ncbi:hypothetical protein [Parvibaculum sp.]|nr:hypothetical protein [Parvibaculum sp.]MBO6679166.1 hypothetical protein [Parvibaculum sp.]MBO6685647.1 hypothetical protein [Parvibaculum sp.]MBO6905798.1 hypothetical protein [Parvibaculum sp.]
MRDKLMARAQAGDEQAIRILLAAVPKDIPRALARSLRDEEIRRLALWLAGRVPDLTPHGAAKIISFAGSAVAKGDPLVGRTYAMLERDERAALADRLKQILAWAPATKRGASWPGVRQTQDILRPAW